MSLPLVATVYGLTFVLALVLLERGADWLTDAVGELAERTGASETVVGLLTAGMEWEELAVAALAAATGNVGIAVGTLIGSNIANITGSFALGPLVRPIAISTDDRRWALVMLVITIGVAALLFIRPEVGRAEGIVLLATFAAYVVGLLIALRRGVIRAAFVADRDHEARDHETPKGHERPRKGPLGGVHGRTVSPRPLPVLPLSGRGRGVRVALPHCSSGQRPHPDPLPEGEGVRWPPSPELSAHELGAGRSPSRIRRALDCLRRGVAGGLLRASAGLGLILVGAGALIQSALFFADLLGVSDYVVGLTLVAIGTTLPDKVISIAGALKGRPGLVTANVIGSNVFNLTFALGLAALVEPLAVDTPTLTFDVPALLAVSALLLWIFRRPIVGRPAGLGLLSLYAGYLAYHFISV